MCRNGKPLHEKLDERSPKNEYTFFIRNSVDQRLRLLFSQFFGFLGNSYRYLRIYLLKAPLSPHAKGNLISSIVNFVYELPHVLPSN